MSAQSISSDKIYNKISIEIDFQNQLKFSKQTKANNVSLPTNYTAVCKTILKFNFTLVTLSFAVDRSKLKFFVICLKIFVCFVSK